MVFREYTYLSHLISRLLTVQNRSILVDFPKPPKPTTKSKPKPKLDPNAEENSATALSRWIVNYFDNVPQPGMSEGLLDTQKRTSGSNAFDKLKREAVIISERMPIILQVSVIFMNLAFPCSTSNKVAF